MKEVKMSPRLDRSSLQFERVPEFHRLGTQVLVKIRESTFYIDNTVVGL